MAQMKQIKLPYFYKVITGVPLKEQNANGSHPGSKVFVYSKPVHLIWSTYPLNDCLKGAKRCCNQSSRESLSEHKAAVNRVCVMSSTV